ncbi:hypothetical protein DRQ26_01305 [bacterium]|nr:MAG: hypothetical protein DRQ26_01305 [bacterium]
MNSDDNKLKLLQQFSEMLGDSQSITLGDVQRKLKKEKLSEELDVDEVMDYLAASGITVLETTVPKTLNDPLAMYFKDISDVDILGKEKELEIAYRMRKTIDELQSMIPLTTLSIAGMIEQGSYLETGLISVDEFTISSFRPDDISPTEHRNDILDAISRLSLIYKKLVSFIVPSRKGSLGTERYWERKQRFLKQVQEEIEFINPSFKVIEDILPVFKKVMDFYQRERDNFQKVLDIAGIGIEDARALFESSESVRKKIIKKFSLGENTIDALANAYRRFSRVERRTMDISLIPIPQLMERIGKLDELVERFERDRETLIKANVRLVVNIARNYMNKGVDFLDLIQDGNHALLKAVERFDPERGYKLSTYAIWWVRQAMICAIAEQGQVIRLPAYLIQWARKYSHIVQELSQKLGREPTNEEIAKKMGISPEDLENMLQALQGQVSLERKLGHDEDSRTIGDIIEDKSSESPSLATTLTVLQQEIKKILDTLTPREAEVIKLRFGLEDNFPRTLEEIGKMFGLSRERIRQIEARALKKLRHPTKIRILEAFTKE